MNCSQIFCTFAVETTIRWTYCQVFELWIALKFFVLLQSKQPQLLNTSLTTSCELLSNFLYFCSRNNEIRRSDWITDVVNCSQIFCTFAVETTVWGCVWGCVWLWIALKFFVLLQSKQRRSRTEWRGTVVNCSQIFCTFAVETTTLSTGVYKYRLWIALKFFVLLQSKQREKTCVFQSNSCELLSNFLYFCSRNNNLIQIKRSLAVVNCSQIFCTFAVETTVRDFLFR